MKTNLINCINIKRVIGRIYFDFIKKQDTLKTEP